MRRFLFFPAPQDAPSAMEGNDTEILCVWKGASSTARTAAALPPTLLLLQAQGEADSTSVRGEGGREEDEHCRALTHHTLPPRHKMPSEEQSQLSPRQQLCQEELQP